MCAPLGVFNPIPILAKVFADARQGKIVEEMDRRVATEEAIMYAAAGNLSTLPLVRHVGAKEFSTGADIVSLKEAESFAIGLRG